MAIGGLKNAYNGGHADECCENAKPRRGRDDHQRRSRRSVGTGRAAWTGSSVGSNSGTGRRRRGKINRYWCVAGDKVTHTELPATVRRPALHGIVIKHRAGMVGARRNAFRRAPCSQGHHRRNVRAGVVTHPGLAVIVIPPALHRIVIEDRAGVCESSPPKWSSPIALCQNPPGRLGSSQVPVRPRRRHPELTRTAAPPALRFPGGIHNRAGMCIARTNANC